MRGMKTHHAFLSLLPSLALAVACVPPPAESPEPEQAAQEPEEGGIPWAEGERPTDAAATTREVGEQPKDQVIDAGAVQEDGIQQSGGVHACTGKVTPALRSAVNERAAQTGSCYGDLPEDKTSAEGDVKFSLRVKTDGTVASLEVLEDSFGVPSTLECLKGVLSQRFSVAPRGGCAVFVIPIHLAAEEQNEEDASEEAPGAN